MWSHKQGLDAVKNTCANDNYNDVMLCDKNISEYATKLNGLITASDVNYYRITKNTDLYSSWHTYGHDDNSIGTPYYNGG